MKIAIMGIRGIPANYGGFETFAENLAPRLVEQGHEVTVYGRSNIIDKDLREYKGVKLKILPTISQKYLDTVVHTFFSVLHSLFQRYDIVLICNAANALFSWIPRLRGSKVIINVDGIERQRKKWNKLAKAYYRISEKLATFAPNEIVTDADVIKDYYIEKYNKISFMIPYGAVVKRSESGSRLVEKFGLQPNKYVLYVSRLEPENNAHMVIKAFENVKTDLHLAIVGGAPYAGEYISKLKKTKDQRIKFLNFVFGQDYQALQQNAYCYIQATEVGGTHPALLEALGFGNCVLALDVPAHREVAGEAAVYFKNEHDLSTILKNMIDETEKIKSYSLKAMNLISKKYSWEMVTDKYLKLFTALTTNGKNEVTESETKKIDKVLH